MLTYSPDARSDLPATTERPWLLLLLAFFWLWPGILGHDPWKPAEPEVLAVVQSMLDGGQWLYPSIDGQAYFEIPPLYAWVAAGFVRLFSSWLLPVHDAARLATPFFMALALTFAGGAGRELIGRRHGRSVVLILMGCLGLMDTGHQLTPVVAAFAGFAAAFYALVLGLRAPALGGALLGAATVALFLSSSLLEVFLLWGVVVLLPVFPAWRTRRYAITVAMAVLFALPMMLIWPWRLQSAHPALFLLWWREHALGPVQGFGHAGVFHEAGFYLRTSLWYAWPAWPLAAWTLWRRRRIDRTLLQLPLVFFGVVMLLLTLSHQTSTELAMPLLLPLSVLAAVELDSVRRGAAAFLNWFALMTFGLFGLAIWAYWAAMGIGWPSDLVEGVHRMSPLYRHHVSWFAAGTAFLATLGWLWALTRRHQRGRQAVTNWAAGITLVWWLMATLALPFMDSFKSYRPVVTEMMAALPADMQGQCISTLASHRLTRISWQYYGRIRLVPVTPEQETPCNWRLQVRDSRDTVLTPGWHNVWFGSRPRQKNEFFVLQQRNDSPVFPGGR